ncbi:MAG: hypothetical protein WBG86_11020 [Polyangiales bacterium]
MQLESSPCALVLASAIIMASFSIGCGDGGVDGTGATGGSGNGLTDAERACQLTDAPTVTSIFEGTASEGTPGTARNCRFEITGGEAQSVSVFFFGADSRWDGTRQGFEDNRGGTTDVLGIGDEAFYPNDTGPSSLVVRANGIIFQISPLLETTFPPSVPSAALEAAVADLARTIANG